MAADPAAADADPAAQSENGGAQLSYAYTKPMTMEQARGGQQTEEAGLDVPVFRFSGGWNVEAWTYHDVRLTVEDGRGNIVLEDPYAQWKKHGNTTLRTAKCSYRFKLSVDADLFGLGEEHNFILLANDFDRTMIRNCLALGLAADMGLGYTSRWRFAEVYVDEVYRGCYLLVEPVQAGSERVDISPARHEYLLGINTRDYNQFVTPVFAYSLVVKEPEKPAEYELSWLTDFLRRAETAMESGDRAELETLVDLDSFLDSYLLYELFKNVDTNSFSTYFYIRDGKLYAGPVWDFDLSAGNIEQDRGAEGWIVQEGWWTRLLEHAWFRHLFAQRLAQRQSLIVNLYQDNELGENRIDAAVAAAGGAIERNYERWNLRQRSYNIEIIPYRTYEENVEYLRAWLAERNQWMLTQLSPENSGELLRAAALKGGGL